MKFSFIKAGIRTLAFAPVIHAAYPAFNYSNEASPPGGEPNASFTAPVVHPLKFNSWGHDFGPELSLISHTVCNLSLAAYHGDMTARATLSVVKDYCWTHGDCIISYASERTKAGFGGSSILLGLAPTSLSLLGPSVAEMALLSFHRPVLALLLSLATPAVYPGRFLIWEDPLRSNEPVTGSFIVSPFSKRWVPVVTVLQYLVALACVGNILDAVYHLGLISMVSWQCRSTYWPMFWVLLSVVIHFTAVFSLRTAMRRKKTDDIAPPIGRGSKPAPHGGFMTHLRNEITPSANCSWQTSDLYDVRLGPLPVALQYAGAFFSILHLVFGTLLFGSIIFLGVADAVEPVMRLIGSATISRLVLQFEVSGMIKVDPSRVYKGIVQASEEKSE
jgi:hypothetical protein